MPSRKNRNVPLAPEMEAFIDGRAASGRLRGAGDVVSAPPCGSPRRASAVGERAGGATDANAAPGPASMASEATPGAAAPAFLAGGGAMGALMRAHDWSASPLGPPEGWARPLKTLAAVMLAANQPMFIAWGTGRTLLYNDGYAKILGLKHPGALGRPFDRVWSEIWGELEPIMARCYAGEPIQMDDITLVMHRRGHPEETHFAFSYTPVRDEAGRVAGVFCPCTEITARVMADRRQAFRLGLEDRLRDLSDPRDAMAAAAEALGRHLDAAQVGYAEVDAGGHATIGGSSTTAASRASPQAVTGWRTTARPWPPTWRRAARSSCTTSGRTSGPAPRTRSPPTRPSPSAPSSWSRS